MTSVVIRPAPIMVVALVKSQAGILGLSLYVVD